MSQSLQIVQYFGSTIPVQPFQNTSPAASAIDPFTVDRTGDSNRVFETMRREILDFKIFRLSLQIARFLCINVLEPDENLTGLT